MKKKKIRLHPALVFLILTIGIMIISSIGSILNLETSYYVVNEATGDLNSQVVNINNLFNRTGLQYLISNMLNNFLNFAPLGNLIIGLLGVGVAYKSGFLNSLFKMISEKVPRKFLTFLVVLLGIIFSMFYEVGYVILIPLAAILFIILVDIRQRVFVRLFQVLLLGMELMLLLIGLIQCLLYILVRLVRYLIRHIMLIYMVILFLPLLV